MKSRSKVNEEWAESFFRLRENQKESLWSVLLDQEKEIVNKFRFYKDI